VAEVDQATGSVKRLYSYYPGVDAPHSMVEGGKTYYYLTEPGAGSVVGLIDSTGVLKNSYRYAPYGLLEDSTEAVVNPLRYTAREYDAETQLYYYRARYYDPTLARFISEDPAGQSAGTNQYAYAMDDPSNRRDPMGLAPWDDDDDNCTPYADGSCVSHVGGRGITTLGYAGNYSKSWQEWGRLINQLAQPVSVVASVGCRPIPSMHRTASHCALLFQLKGGGISFVELDNPGCHTPDGMSSPQCVDQIIESEEIPEVPKAKWTWAVVARGGDAQRLYEATMKLRDEWNGDHYDWSNRNSNYFVCEALLRAHVTIRRRDQYRFRATSVLGPYGLENCRPGVWP
jgi:RHS repeat-associated protein